MPTLPTHFVLAALFLPLLAGCGDRDSSVRAPERVEESGAKLDATIETSPSSPEASPEAPDGDIAAIPERFQGRWDVDPAACAGRPGEMRLTVAPDRLLFHESVARVAAVRPGEANAVVVDLALEGEGETWRETRTLRLTGEDRLEVTVGDVSSIRVRCDEG
jgi:hypothetical protein